MYFHKEMTITALDLSNHRSDPHMQGTRRRTNKQKNSTAKYNMNNDRMMQTPAIYCGVFATCRSCRSAESSKRDYATVVGDVFSVPRRALPGRAEPRLASHLFYAYLDIAVLATIEAIEAIRLVIQIPVSTERRTCLIYAPVPLYPGYLFSQSSIRQKKE
jgi:hypothetical protein